jgi:hypothetical protein
MSDYDRRHELHIESLGTVSKRCHHTTTYRVTSRFEVSADSFAKLRECGFFSSGQSWRVSASTKKEMRYTPEGKDWYGRSFGEVSMPYFEYTVTNECNSGD